MLLDSIDITTDRNDKMHVTGISWDMLARHSTLPRVQQRRYFLRGTSSMILLWREWSVCFRSPAASLVDGFPSFGTMKPASKQMENWWTLNWNVHQHPAWKPPSLYALRFAEVQTADAHGRQSPIQISCWASWTWLRKEKQLAELAGGFKWMYESGIYPIYPTQWP